MDRPSLYRALVFYFTPVLAISAAAWLVTRPVSTSAHETLEEKNAHLWQAALGPRPTPSQFAPENPVENRTPDANRVPSATAPMMAATPPAQGEPLPQFVSETGAFAQPPTMPPNFGAAPNEPADSMFATMRRTEREMAPRFEAWKRAYSGHVDKFLTFYAPDAKVSLAPGKTLTFQEFAKTKRALNKREAKLIVEGNSDSFGSGSSSGGMNDMQNSVPLFFGRVDGKQGVERVVQFEWQKRNGVWLIVNEQQGASYPSRYALVPAGKLAPPLQRALSSTTTQDDARFLERVARTRNTRERRALLNVYQRWQKTHFGPVEPYMELYAPDARVHTAGPTISCEQLRTEALQVRAAKQYDLVSDKKPPQIALDGDRAEIRAHLRYEFSGDHTVVTGPRRLLWQRQNGAWRILEDFYSFDSTPRTSFPEYSQTDAAMLAKLPRLILMRQPARADDPQFLARAQKSPAAARRELMQRYTQWHKTLRQPDEHYNGNTFYVSDALIVQPNNQPLERALQRDADNQALSSSHWTTTKEDRAPQIAISGDKAEVRVRRVLQTSPNSKDRVSGDWRLFWRKQNGRWLITREERPLSYDSLPTAPTPTAIASPNGSFGRF